MRSIILSFLVLISAIPCATSAVIFSDDFESGWSQTSNNGWTKTMSGGYVSTGTVCFKGTHGLTCVDNQAGAFNAYITRTITVETTGYTRFYMKLEPGFLGYLHDDFDNSFIFNMTTQDADTYIALLTRLSGGTTSFALRCSVDNAYTYATYATRPEENRWYCMEIKVSSFNAATTIDWWVDGTYQAQVVKDYAVGGYLGPIRLGLDAVTSSTWLQTIYYDEYIVSDDYNGPLPSERSKTKVFGGTIE